MRKSILILLSLALFSCAETDERLSENGLFSPPDNRNYIKYGKINADDALEIALNAPYDFYGDQISKSQPVFAEDVVPVLRKKDPKAIGTDTLMYIVNYTGGRGYSVISSDTRTGDVLAIVEEGSFNIADTAGNSLKKFLFERMVAYQCHGLDSLAALDTKTKGASGIPPVKEYAGYMRNYRGNRDVINKVDRNFSSYNFNIRNPEPYEATIYGDSYYLSKGCIGQWNFTQTTNVCNPLIQTKWGQGNPFNKSSPYFHPDGTISDEKLTVDDQRTPTGCVALAVAQIMVYHGWPKTYPEGLRYAGPTYIDELKNKITGSAFRTESDIKKVSNFIRNIGDVLGNIWGEDGSASGINSAPECFEKMGYPKFGYAVPYNIYLITESLKNKRPVLIEGLYEEFMAHDWIIDGYVLKQVGYDYFYFDENAKYTKYKFQDWISEQYYFSCNFGWSKDQDGYYLDKLFITKYLNFNYDPSSLIIIPNIHK